MTAIEHRAIEVVDEAPECEVVRLDGYTRRGVTPQLTVRSRCVGWRSHAKRGVDIAASSSLIVLLAPLLGVLAVVTKLASPGPVLFRQRRVGRSGTLFEMFKFRTMYTDSTERLATDPALYECYVSNDYKIPERDDPRIMPVGRLLRRSSLDELPQLINVLRGEMSLVGPRPVVEEELHEYGPMIEAYTHVRPGITGRWQTEGRNEIRYPERAMLDAAYVEEFRLRDDIAILCRTIPCVIRGSGVR